MENSINKHFGTLHCLATSHGVFYAFIVLISLWCTLNTIFGEKVYDVHPNIATNKSFDSSSYVTLALNPDTLFSPTFGTAYLVQRSLPSFIVHGVLKIVGAEITQANVLSVFEGLALFSTLLSIFLFYLICLQLQFSAVVTFLGLAFLFINFAVLKYFFYSPAQTDPLAFMVGMLAAYAYFSRNKILLLLTVPFGAFIWPTQSIVSLLLFVSLTIKPIISKPNRYSLNNIFSIISAIIIAFILVTLAYRVYRDNYAYHSKWFMQDVVLLSYITLGLWVGLGFYYFLRANNWAATIKETLTRKQFWGAVIISALFYGLVIATIKMGAKGLAQGFTLKALVSRTLSLALLKPAGNIVAHTMFLGVFPLLIVLFYFRQVVYFAYHNGLWVVFPIFILLGLHPETRGLTNIWILALIPLLQVLQSKTLKTNKLLLCGLVVSLQIIYSGVWDSINSDFYANGDTALIKLFTRLGPWNTIEDYKLYLIANLLVLPLLWWLFVKQTTDKSDSAEPTPITTPHGVASTPSMP